MEDEAGVRPEAVTAHLHPANTADEVMFRVAEGFKDESELQARVRGVAIELVTRSIGDQERVTGKARMKEDLVTASPTMPLTSLVTATSLESLPAEDARRVIEAILRELGVTQPLTQIEESIEVALDGSGIARKDGRGSYLQDVRLVLSKALTPDGRYEKWRVGIAMDPSALNATRNILIQPSKFLAASTNAPII